LNEILKIILTATGSFFALFFLTKIIGKRQLSQLSLFDYIIGISIGSIAAEMATSLDGPFTHPLTAMIVYAALSLIFTFFVIKSMPARKKIEGTPVILFNSGKMYRNNFKKNKIDLDEFLMLCRNEGYFNLSAVQTIVLEQNGKLSILPKSAQRPPTAQELNIYPMQETLEANIIMDGKIMENNLSLCGHDSAWIMSELSVQGVKNIGDVFLATLDSNNKLTVYLDEKINTQNGSKLDGK